MQNRLFVYGTLKDAGIQKKVLGRVVFGESDTLCGYKQGTVTFGDETYPGIEEDLSKKESVEGIVLLLDDDELLKADFYEGSYYKRCKVTLMSGNSADVYIPQGARCNFK